VQSGYSEKQMKPSTLSYLAVSCIGAALLASNADVIGELLGALAGGAALALPLFVLIGGLVVASFTLGALRHHRWVQERLQDHSDNDTGDARVVEPTRSMQVRR
jgi:uncharacterized membrane protein